MTDQTKRTMIVPVIRDPETNIYSIRVHESLWPTLAELLVKAGKLRDVEVNFEITTKGPQS